MTVHPEQRQLLAQLLGVAVVRVDVDRALEEERLIQAVELFLNSLPRALGGNRYGEVTQHAVFYLDPHVCLRCRYRSTELLWQCPHCHDWNTFVEERIAPAQDATEVEV
ncbi:MAG: hypothetical protein AB7Q16_23210 [Vicinamibacterales bacterium]